MKTSEKIIDFPKHNRQKQHHDFKTRKGLSSKKVIRKQTVILGTYSKKFENDSTELFQMQLVLLHNFYNCW